MEVEVEIGVVDPDGLADPRYRGERLAQPGHHAELGLDGRSDALDVERPAVEPQRRRLGEGDHPDVHVGASVLDGEEAEILPRQSLVMGLRHRLGFAVSSRDIVDS